MISLTHDNDGYEELKNNLKLAPGPLFTVACAPLFPRFLAALPESMRQHYTCNCCRHFFERYGNVVTVSENGTVESAIWPKDAPPVFAAAMAEMRKSVENLPIEGVFLPASAVLGTPQSDPDKHGRVWSHFSVRAVPFQHATLNADQAMAEKREDRKMLLAALADFRKDVAEKALAMLTSGQLYRSEKCEAVARWFVDVHGLRKPALIWRAVATAPVGFCHIRSSMIGTLLEDIAAGLPFEQIKARFDAKMNPLQYQRPQAPPSDGNIARAEKIFADLGLARSLERRFARLDEVQAIWKPKEAPKAGGIFGHLRPATKPTDIGTTRMTWEKFARDVLPKAEAIEFDVPHSSQGYCALVTAVHADAPPILQWDMPEQRNPVSWYLYANGSLPMKWNLSPGSTVNVTAIALKPSMWAGEKFSHQGQGVLFILDGCRDVDPRGGSALFPEILKSELREIRSVIEAHSKGVQLASSDASACGLLLSKGRDWNTTICVTAAGVRTGYLLDRWE